MTLRAAAKKILVQGVCVGVRSKDEKVGDLVGDHVQYADSIHPTAQLAINVNQCVVRHHVRSQSIHLTQEEAIYIMQQAACNVIHMQSIHCSNEES